MQAVEPRLVAFDPSSGLAQSVKYDELAAVLAAVVKDHQQKFDDLTADQPAPWFVSAVGKAIAMLTDLTTSRIVATQSVTAPNVTASNQLCAGSVCVTPDQLQALLQLAGQASTTPRQGSSAATSTASSTPADTEPPTLTVQGNNPATVTVGDEYADLGATARDNSGIATVRTYQGGGEVTAPVIDTSTPGSYTIEYRATDPSGNLATSTRTVIVRPANDVQATTTATAVK